MSALTWASSKATTRKAQGGVDTETMMVITAHVAQACNDEREVLLTLEQIQALPAVLDEVKH